MTEDILEENNDLIERITHSPEIEERQELVKELVEGIPLIILKRFEEKKKEMEKIIKSKNTDCVDLEINPEHKDLMYWDEIDKTRIIRSINLETTNEDIKSMIMNDIRVAIGELMRGRDGGEGRTRGSRRSPRV